MVYQYELGDKEALFEITTRTTYSAYTLINSVKDYLSSNFSMLDIVKKYNLSGDSVLKNWLKRRSLWLEKKFLNLLN